MNSFNYRIGWLEADFAVLRAKYENLDSRILEMESRLQKLELRADFLSNLNYSRQTMEHPLPPLSHPEHLIRWPKADYPSKDGSETGINPATGHQTTIPEPETPLPAIGHGCFVGNGLPIYPEAPSASNAQVCNCDGDLEPFRHSALPHD